MVVHHSHSHFVLSRKTVIQFTRSFFFSLLIGMCHTCRRTITSVDRFTSGVVGCLWQVVTRTHLRSGCVIFWWWNIVKNWLLYKSVFVVSFPLFLLSLVFSIESTYHGEFPERLPSSQDRTLSVGTEWSIAPRFDSAVPSSGWRRATVVLVFRLRVTTGERNRWKSRFTAFCRDVTRDSLSRRQYSCPSKIGSRKNRNSLYSYTVPLDLSSSGSESSERLTTDQDCWNTKGFSTCGQVLFLLFMYKSTIITKFFCVRLII